MRKILTGLLTVACITDASQTAAITFPSLTTIYIGTGVQDSGSPDETGIATVFQCSNVSGATAQVRFLVLETTGAVVGEHTRSLPHGTTTAVATHFTLFFPENAEVLPSGGVTRGTINIESTESGVFCQAYVTDAATIVPNVVPLELVRVNPHPGTVE